MAQPSHVTQRTEQPTKPKERSHERVLKPSQSEQEVAFAKTTPIDAAQEKAAAREPSKTQGAYPRTFLSWAQCCKNAKGGARRGTAPVAQPPTPTLDPRPFEAGLKQAPERVDPPKKAAPSTPNCEFEDRASDRAQFESDKREPNFPAAASIVRSSGSGGVHEANQSHAA